MLDKVATPGIARKIREYYGSSAEKIVENLEIDKLMEVPGLGRKTALSILRQAYELKTGEKFQDILCNDAVDIYEDLLERLQEYPCTQNGKNRILVHYPVINKNIIEERLQYSREAVEFVSSLTSEAVSQLVEKLGHLSPLAVPRKKKYRDRVIAVDTIDVYTDLKNEYCDVLLIEDPADISALEQYSLVFYVYTADSALYEHLLERSDMQFLYDDFALAEAIPELEIEKFTENERTIFLMCEISDILHQEDAPLKEVRSALESLKEKRSFTEYNVEALVDDLETRINKKLDEAIQKEQIELKGKEILSMMQQMHTDPVQALRKSIPGSIISLYSRLVGEANREITEKIGMRAEVFSLELAYPLEADRERIEELNDDIRKGQTLKEFKASRNAARIGKYWEYLLEKERDMHELDFKTALGRFFIEFRMTAPSFVEAGLSFSGGINITIKNAQPVCYKIGETPHQFATSHRTSVLTGANSGGKTTLLETMLYIQILAQMGFFVPAEECFCPICQEIIYLRKPKSQDAGAFESTLRNLIPLALSGTKNLVLIDELEAITEPGSAAKIIASFLTFLAQNENALCTLVTHLGKEISELTTARMDGIEATGLDEALELVVDRQPVFGKVGKSTPELIVEKLYKKSSGREKAVYEKILQDFSL
jgi:DNA mismatch repair protein MutS2